MTRRLAPCRRVPVSPRPRVSLSRPPAPGPPPPYSILTQRAVNGVRLAAFDRSFSVVAVGADRSSRRAAMFEARLLMHIVTVDAGWKIRAGDRHVSHIAQDVAVSGIQALIIRF